MARQAGTIVENNFTKGLITEASGLNFPENACTDELNCIFKPTGQVVPRTGFDIEPNGEFIPSVFNPNGAITEYIWNAVAKTGMYSFLVQQYGEVLYFFHQKDDSSLSVSRKPFSVSLGTFRAPGATALAEHPVSCSSGNGRLFVVHPGCDPFFIQYDIEQDDIIVKKIEIKVRDFEGVEDGLSIDEQPTVLSNEHKYNLHNQGWWMQDIRSQVAPGTALSGGGGFRITPANPHQGIEITSPITYWYKIVKKYPANNMLWWSYKRPVQVTPSSIPKNYQEVFDPEQRHHIVQGNTPAPKGHFILNAFHIDRSAVSGIPGIPLETSGGKRPSSSAFYAGRAWYAGVHSVKFNTRIYFSQIIERDEQVGMCHQAQDPTEEDAPDLLPTDGGVIVIPEIEEVIALFPQGEGLLIFASNGIWRVSGSEGIGFRANDYSVTKVSETPALSASSIVSVDGSPVWWNTQGIWALQLANIDQVSVTALTDATIKSFFETIPANARKYAKGAYDRREGVVQWLYSKADPGTVSGRYNYDAILNLNIQNTAFYNFSFDNSRVKIKGIFSSGGVAQKERTENVTVNGETVTVNGDPVTVTDLYDVIVDSMFRYILEKDQEVTFGEMFRIDYTDWVDAGEPSDYTSFFDSGYQIPSGGERRMASTYVVFNYETETRASAFFQAKWNYARSSDTGKYSSRQQIMTNNDLRFKHRKVRLKVRGSGVALQFRIEGEKGKPFTLNGWSVMLTGGTGV